MISEIALTLINSYVKLCDMSGKVELTRAALGPTSRHERMGARLAGWVEKAAAADKTDMRVKTGPLGINDTTYDSRTYSVAAELLRAKGIEIEAHRFTEHIPSRAAYSNLMKIPMGLRQFEYEHPYDRLIVVSIGGMAVNEEPLDLDQVPGHVAQLYPSPSAVPESADV